MTTAASSRPLAQASDGSDRTFLPGLAAGQAAGLIMAVVVMAVFTLFLGKGPLYPVQVIGSVFFGEAALNGFHLGALLAGLLIHQLGPSLVWGALFGILARPLGIVTRGPALMLGLAIGVAAMVDPYLLVPAAMKAMQGVDFWHREVPILWDWAAHLVFGASFVLYPAIKAKLAR